MKKFVTILLLLAIGFTASAQDLTMKQVLAKATKVLPIKDGITGNVAIKSIGIGETTKFATDGVSVYTSLDDEQDWIIDGIEYTVNTKEKTLTIEDCEEALAIMLMPYGIANGLNEDNPKIKAELTDAKMKKSGSEYKISFKMKGMPMELYIDSKTFQIKGMKMKKGIITILSVFYSNLKKLTNPAILKFDRSKYSTYKVIDERGKGKKKKKSKK